MKILKRILIVLLILIAIPLIVAAFMKKDYHVERSIVVNQPQETVFEYVRCLKNQDDFSVWNMKDPGMTKTYSGTDGEVGFISSWDSDNKEVGSGSQEIIKVTPNKRVDMKLKFKEPMEAEDFAFFTTTALSPTQTKVVWGFDGDMPWPMNFMMLFMDMEEMLGKDLEAGLKNLKQELEH